VAAGAIDPQFAIHRVQRHLLRQRRQLQRPAGGQLHVQVERGREGGDGRGTAESLADQHAHLRIAHGEFGNRSGGRVRERGLGLLVGARQRGPELQAMVHVGRLAQIVRTALGVHDAAPRRHPVDGARLDPLHRAHAVAVHHRALEQVGHRGQADVGMRANVMVGSGLFGHGTEMVEEQERADRLALGRRQ
jgi:hypothetical protein